MNTALVIGHTGGIGSAITTALTAQGTQVTGVSRSTHGFDLRDPGSLENVLNEIHGPFDLIFVATGALEIDGAAPEKTIKALTPQVMADQFAVNTIGPAMVLRQAPRLLHRTERSMFVVLSARVGSIGDNHIGGWASYRSVKAAVNQVIHTGAIELARTHPDAVCIALHPGTVESNFTRKYLGRHPAVSPETAAANMMRVMDGLTPADTGAFLDYKGQVIPW